MLSQDELPSDGAPDAFSSLLVALQGVRILEKPRVSREVKAIFAFVLLQNLMHGFSAPQVIIFVLREHTEMMREFKQVIPVPVAIIEFSTFSHLF